MFGITLQQKWQDFPLQETGNAAIFLAIWDPNLRITAVINRRDDVRPVDGHTLLSQDFVYEGPFTSFV